MFWKEIQSINYPKTIQLNLHLFLYRNSRTDGFCSKCYNHLFGEVKPVVETNIRNLENISETQEDKKNNQFNVSNPIVMSSRPMQQISSKYNENVSCSLPIQIKLGSMMDIDSQSTGTSPSSIGDNSLTKKRKTCYVQGCKKKLSLTSVECRCGHSFCSLHRYAEQHDCPFDYKTAKQEILNRENPTVTASKINQI